MSAPNLGQLSGRLWLFLQSSGYKFNSADVNTSMGIHTNAHRQLKHVRKQLFVYVNVLRWRDGAIHFLNPAVRTEQIEQEKLPPSHLFN